MIQAFDRNDWPSILELVAVNARAYVGSMEADREGWRQMGMMFATAFPDAKHEITSVHLDGEYATLVCNFTGTHKGSFMGIPASGRKIAFEVIHVDRIVDGRIVEHRGQFDSAGLMQQIAPDYKAFVENVFTLIDSQQFAAVKELFMPNGRFVMGAQAMSPDQWAGFSQGFFAAFPDLRHNHEEIITAGNKVVHTGYVTGTQKGAFQGVPATGRSVRFSYTGLMTIVDGKILEERVEADFGTLMQQLTA